jgi:hypothetical protein
VGGVLDDCGTPRNISSSSCFHWLSSYLWAFAAGGVLVMVLLLMPSIFIAFD